MSITPRQAQAVYRQSDRLFSAEQVEEALDRMAAEISASLAECNPLVLCVMTGAVIVTGHLLTRLDFPLQLDYLHATRYGAETSGGEIRWLARPAASLAGRTVLVVDDILDEGHTLAAIVSYCRSKGCAAVHVAALVEKRHLRKAPGVMADFVGLEVEDRYVFGFGMDYKGYLRNLPGIHAVREEQSD